MRNNKKHEVIPSFGKKRWNIRRIEAGEYPIALEWLDEQIAYKATHIERERKRLEWLEAARDELKKRLGV